MSLRIAVAGFAHQTNTFALGRTDLGAFAASGIHRGSELLDLRGTNTVIGGALDAIASDPSLAAEPLIATRAISGGVVTAGAIDAIAGAIVAGLARSRPDAVVLDLHGAMVTEAADDGEGVTLRRLRATVGPAVPIAAVLDLHANVSAEMVALADILLPYETYPHVDNAERGAEAVRLVARVVRGELRPVSSLVRLPLISASPNQCTTVEPARSIMASALAAERRPGVVNAGVCFGFAYADVPIAGASTVVTTDGDQLLADRLARELADELWAVREAFRPETMTVEEAVHAAMAEPRGPVVLADLGDNPGGGTPGDGTALLWALLDLGAANAALGVVADPEVVDAAFAAGIGARLGVLLGGKTDERHGYPLPIAATVRSLSDGHFVYEGPVNRGVHDTLGRTAVLAAEGRHGQTVDLIVCERRVQPYDLAIFRSQGIEPSERAIVAVKSAVHFRGGFGPIATRIIGVDTPGLTALDLTRFPYRRIPRPIWPLDPL